MAEPRVRPHSDPAASKAIDNLSPEELAELREAFRVFDQDGDVGDRPCLGWTSDGLSLGKYHPRR